jgi:hypothetical protein
VPDILLAGFCAGTPALFKAVGLAPLLAISTALIVLRAYKKDSIAKVIIMFGTAWVGAIMPFDYCSANWRISRIYSLSRTRSAPHLCRCNVDQSGLPSQLKLNVTIPLV